MVLVPCLLATSTSREVEGSVEHGAQQKPDRVLPVVFFLIGLLQTYTDFTVIASHDSLQMLKVIKGISLKIQSWHYKEVI